MKEPSALRHPAEKNRFSWVIALGVLAALLIPSTRLLVGTQNGDGILTSIISTQKLTWYFWGQDRLLNFIPALAALISKVEWNLRFQIFLRAFFAYLAPLGILCFFTRSARLLIVGVALCNCLLALIFSQLGSFNLYVEHNPFGTSLVLFAFSLYLFRRGETNAGWIAASLLAGFFAYATDFGLLTLSLPLLALAFCTGLLPRKQVAIFFVINALVILAAYKHSQLVGGGTTPFKQLSASWQAVHSGYLSVNADVSWIPLLLLSIVVVAAGFIRRTPYTCSILLLMAGSVALIGIVSCSIWPQTNGYHLRYYIIYIISITAAASYLVAATLAPLLQKPFHSGLAAMALLGIQIVVPLHGISIDSYGELVGSPWRDASREIAIAAKDNDVQLVIGEFWDVWPAVFDTLRISPDRVHGDNAIYGVTFRSSVLANRLLKLSKQKGSLKAICLKDNVADCKKTAAMSLWLHTTVAANSVKEVTVADKHMLLMNITLANPAPLIAGQTSASVEQEGSPTFLPGEGKLRVIVKLTNSGSVEFTSEGHRPVRMGVQLLAVDGKVAETDYGRADIPDLEPGQARSVTVDISSAKLDDHDVLILPVQDGVAWFDVLGTKGIKLGPFHACTLDAKPWLCDAAEQPLAKGM